MPISLEEIPKPSTDELWELWCLKVFTKMFSLPGLKRYRTSGYPQEGIDLYGTRSDGKIVGIQCKLRSTEKELTERDAGADLARWVGSGLNIGVFAIACSHPSTALQKWAARQSRDGLEVSFFAWSNITDFLKTTPSLLDELTDAKRINDARDELVYSRALVKLRDKVNLYAIEKAVPEVREPPLTAAYVSLGLAEVTRDGAEPERVGGSYSIEQVMDTLQAAPWHPIDDATSAANQTNGSPSGRAEERRTRPNNVLVLEGEAGRGKTTLLRYIAVQTAKARETALESAASLPEYRTAVRNLSWRDRVPFYREVRSATESRPIEDLDHLACEVLKSHPESVASDWPRSVVNAGRALVLLDGVDEVPDGQPRVTLLAKIHRLVEQNPKTLFVISARPGAADGLRRELAAMNPRVARVQALAGPKLQDFIIHWHHAVIDMAKGLYSDEHSSRRVREIAAALEDLPPKLDAARHIKALMSTPLLAALVCAYHLDHQALPEDQTELMTNLAYCLIDYHDRLRPDMQVCRIYAKLRKGEKLQILGSIAADMVQRLSPTIACDPELDAGTDAFDGHLREFMATAAWFQEPEIEQLRTGLIDRTGVLHEVQRGVLSFIHNEFRDFLAARYLIPKAANPAVYQTIANAMTDQDWHGLIYFAVTAETNNPGSGVADRLVHDLLNIVNAPPRNVLGSQVKTLEDHKLAEKYLSLRRIAFRLAGARPPVSAAKYAELQAVRNSMLPPTTMEDAEIVSELGTTAIPELAYDSTRDGATRAACAYALRLIDHELARDARRVYAEHETDWGVLEELAQTIPVADLAFVARCVTDSSIPPVLGRDMATRLVRQAAGLDGQAIAPPALALARRLPRLLFRDADSLIGLLTNGEKCGLDFVAEEVSLHFPVDPKPLATLSSKTSGLKALTSLQIVNSQLTEEDVEELSRPESGLTGLKSLFLISTKVTEEGWKRLARSDTGLTALTRLNLNGTEVTDSILGYLTRTETGLKCLTSLELFSSQLTDAGVAQLAHSETGLKKLTELTLCDARVTDSGLKELTRTDTGMSGLTHLDLSHTAVTDSGLKDLARSDSGLKGLTSLDLFSTDVTDAGVIELTRPDTGLKALTTLNLGRTRVTDAGLTYLSRADTGLKVLTTLELSRTRVTDAGLTAISRPASGLSGLTTLVLFGTQVTDAGLEKLSRADTGLARLKNLDLFGTNITNAGLKHLARPATGVKGITWLRVAHTAVTDAGLEELAKEETGLKSLESVFLTLNEPNMTEAGIEACRRRWPAIQITWQL